MQDLLPLSVRLSAVAGEAFAEIGEAAELGLVRRSDRLDLADFQCNGALAAAKRSGRAAIEIAEEIARHLSRCEEVDRAEAAAPGFVNIVVSVEALGRRVGVIAEDAKSGGGQTDRAETIFLDFGGLNIAKPMHVGHLRSLIIGDSLQRLFRFRGHRVISDVHLGDWGLQMGMLISELERESPELPWFRADFSGKQPEESPVGLQDMERLYRQASLGCKRDSQCLERAHLATAELQGGNESYRSLWRHFKEVTRVSLDEECDILGVSFDIWRGESDVQELISGMLSDLQSAGLAHEDDGALIFPVMRENDSKEYPPLILRNARGASGYQTTDLATILERTGEHDPDRILYVVDQRQALHFEQLFRAADKAGYMEQDRLEHIGFGTMNGEDGKPFRTRDGGVLRLRILLDQAREAARRQLAEGSEIDDISWKVALSAIKFADLSNMRRTNYVFDLGRFTSFEGYTGPYLLYAAVRIKSLLRKAGEEGEMVVSELRPEHSEERAVALALDGFALVLSEAERKRAPHLICQHLYDLAQAFSVLYGKLPLAKEGDRCIRMGRLVMARAVLRQLETGLSLIGIEVPERM